MEAKKKTERPYEERCGGGQCKLKASCKLHLIPRDHARYSVIKSQILKDGDKCGAYEVSSVAQVFQEIRMLKKEMNQLDCQNN